VATEVPIIQNKTEKDH